MAQQIKSLSNLSSIASFNRFIIDNKLNKPFFEEIFNPTNTRLTNDIKIELLMKNSGYLFYLYLRSRDPGPNLDTIYYCLIELNATCADTLSILIIYSLFLEDGNIKYRECVKYLKQFIPDIIRGINIYNSQNSDNPLQLLFKNTYDLNDIDYLFDLIKANYYIYGEEDLMDRTNATLQNININDPDFNGVYQQYLANPNDNDIYMNVVQTQNFLNYIDMTFSLLSGRLDIFNVIITKDSQIFINLIDGLSWFLQNLVISECYYLVEKAINNFMTPGNGIMDNNKIQIIRILMHLLFVYVNNGKINNPRFIKDVYNLANKHIKLNQREEMSIFVYKSLIYNFLKTKTTNIYYKSPLLNELNGLNLRENYVRNENDIEIN